MDDAIAGVVEINLEPQSVLTLGEIGLIMERARLRGDDDTLLAARECLNDLLKSLEHVPGDLHGFTASGARKLTCFFKFEKSLLTRMAALRAR
jgi:hypothetical protein